MPTGDRHPTKLEVEGPLVLGDVQEVREILELHSAPAAFATVARAQILAACAATHLETHDLVPALQQSGEGGRRGLYSSQDWHLNRDGHRAVAEALAPRLAEMLLAR